MRTLSPLLNTGGFVTHLIWVIAIAALAPTIAASAIISPVALITGFACVAFPGLAGLFLARRSAPRFGRLVLSVLWVALAAAVATTGGGIIGPAACAFLLPVAAMASFGGRAAIIEASAFSGATVVLLFGLQLSGVMPLMSANTGLIAPFFLPVALFTALGFGFAAWRSARNVIRLRQISRKHRKQSDAFAKSPLPIVKTHNGKIVAISDAARQVFPGLPPDVTGLPFSDLTDEDSSKAACPVRKPSGQFQPYELYTSETNVTIILPVKPAKNSEETTRLISERDNALLDAKAKSEFLASVSHEIRTPLNAIIGFSDAMKARLFGPVPAKYAEYAELINESGRHLHELISDVLDLSKIEADSYELKRERFNAKDVIELCVRMLSQRAVEAGITVEQAVESDLTVSADRKGLRQILLNLLSNSIKFTPSGGAIVVMAHAEGDHLVLAVGDSGPGIPENELAELGQRYKQASTADQSAERGSGLGLSLVKALAEMHDGEMKISSTLGEGTTVSVSMPVIDAGRNAEQSTEPLEVHSRIERAQTASRVIASSASG